MTEEPLAEVLYRWAHDSQTLKEASPEELEAAKKAFVERMDAEHTAGQAGQDQRAAQLRDLNARIEELRRKLGRDEEA